MPTFATLQQDSDNRDLIRKIQRAVAFVAPTTVTLPTTLFGTDGTLVDLKTAGFLPVGIVDASGYEFGRAIKATDVTALGYASPVRSDIDSVARTVKMTALETGRKHMLELTYGTDLTATTQAATTGEVIVDEPDLPVSREYRMLIVGSDGPADNNWILGRGYGLVKLAATDNQKWDMADATSQVLTFNVFTDELIGTPVRHYIGGTGAKAASTSLGFTAGV